MGQVKCGKTRIMQMKTIKCIMDIPCMSDLPHEFAKITSEWVAYKYLICKTTLIGHTCSAIIIIANSCSMQTLTDP